MSEDERGPSPDQGNARKKLEGRALEIFEESFKRNEKLLRKLAEM